MLGKNRTEWRQGSELSACRLALLVVLEASVRFWQQRGEFMPVHDLNLWLLFLFVFLALLVAPKGKFLLHERGGKGNPQKWRAEMQGGEATPKGMAWSSCRDVGEAVAVGADNTHPPIHPGLGSHQSRPVGSQSRT